MSNYSDITNTGRSVGLSVIRLAKNAIIINYIAAPAIKAASTVIGKHAGRLMLHHDISKVDIKAITKEFCEKLSYELSGKYIGINSFGAIFNGIARSFVYFDPDHTYTSIISSLFGFWISESLTGTKEIAIAINKAVTKTMNRGFQLIEDREVERDIIEKITNTLMGTLVAEGMKVAIKKSVLRIVPSASVWQYTVAGAYVAQIVKQGFLYGSQKLFQYIPKNKLSENNNPINQTNLSQINSKVYFDILVSRMGVVIMQNNLAKNPNIYHGSDFNLDNLYTIVAVLQQVKTDLAFYRKTHDQFYRPLTKLQYNFYEKNSQIEQMIVDNLQYLSREYNFLNAIDSIEEECQNDNVYETNANQCDDAADSIDAFAVDELMSLNNKDIELAVDDMSIEIDNFNVLTAGSIDANQCHSKYALETGLIDNHLLCSAAI